jgi:hypothetical protein
MLAAGDPIATALHAQYRATMPNLRVGDRDLAALLEFLGDQADENRAAPAHAEHAVHVAAEPAKAP